MYQWCGFKSRRGKNTNFTALKSNSNTVWFNFQTYICYSQCVKPVIWPNDWNFLVNWSNATDRYSFGQMPKISSHLAKWLKMSALSLTDCLIGNFEFSQYVKYCKKLFVVCCFHALFVYNLTDCLNGNLFQSLCQIL